MLLPVGTAMASLNRKRSICPGHWILNATKQKAKKVVMVLVGVSEPSFQGQVRCHHKMEPREVSGVPPGTSMSKSNC